MVQPPARVFDDVPVLCGHRGSGRGIVGGQRENTLGSCRAAVAAGIRWVEVDVRAASDGALVASHDPIVPSPAADTGLMLIEELLEDLPPEIGVNLEIKTELADARRPRAGQSPVLSYSPASTPRPR